MSLVQDSMLRSRFAFTLDFDAVMRRLEEFVKQMIADLGVPEGQRCELSGTELANADKCRRFDELLRRAGDLSGEERLFYLLLATHFDSPRTAYDFYQKLNWASLLGSNEAAILLIASRFFQRPQFIGDHRRHFRCLETAAEKAQFTVKVLKSYKNTIEAAGSQAEFFGVAGSPEFNALYQKMRSIEHFDRRLPRFDHLERLARAYDFYIVPRRFYVEDDRGGPRDGVTYLIIGARLRRNKWLRGYLVTQFPAEWNQIAAVDKKYRIPDRASLGEVLRKLESWTIDCVRMSLPDAQRNSPAFVFDLESCLCNWQKRKA